MHVKTLRASNDFLSYDSAEDFIEALTPLLTSKIPAVIELRERHKTTQEVVHRGYFGRWKRIDVDKKEMYLTINYDGTRSLRDAFQDAELIQKITGINFIQHAACEVDCAGLMIFPKWTVSKTWRWQQNRGEEKSPDQILAQVEIIGLPEKGNHIYLSKIADKVYLPEKEKRNWYNNGFSQGTIPIILLTKSWETFDEEIVHAFYVKALRANRAHGFTERYLRESRNKSLNSQHYDDGVYLVDPCREKMVMRQWHSWADPAFQPSIKITIVHWEDDIIPEGRLSFRLNHCSS